MKSLYSENKGTDFRVKDKHIKGTIGKLLSATVRWKLSMSI